jgi:hypothetical protein
VAGVLVGEKRTVGGEAVDALPRAAAVAFARALIGDRAKELAFLVLAAPLIPVVGDDRDEVVLDELLNAWIGKSERTARDAVVSSAAERVPVHLPQQDRFAFRGGFLAGFGQTHAPTDGEPCILIRLRRHRRDDCINLRRRQPVSRRQREQQ